MAEPAAPDVGEKPYQPRDYEFPKRSYGVKTVLWRSFQPQWFDLFPSLHWDTATKKVFCHICVRAWKLKMISTRNVEPAFISTGFQNWKEAKRVMAKHAESGCHKEAVERLISIPQSSGDVGEALDSQLAVERRNSRECLLHILRCIKFLARQGLALRGGSKDDGETDGNFLRLLMMFADNNESLVRWLERRTDKYTSVAIQNEILQTMALRILRQTASKIRGRMFSIMVDETTDCSTVEQCVIVIRWVDDKLETHEDFIGFYALPVANSDTIVEVIKDALVRLGLNLSDCRGQCYDGAAVMKGVRNGVATQILADQPKALLTHCYGHSLNLACQDMVRSVKPVKDALDTTFELSKLLKFSAKRAAEFQRLKKEIAPEEPGFRTLCPTRWTVRASSLASVLTNYEVLQASLEKFTDMAKYDHEMSAKCNGVRTRSDEHL